MVSPLGQLRPQRPHSRSLDELVTFLGPVVSWAQPASPVTITGVALASSDVVAGDLFVAVPGARTHGARYSAQAVAQGAVAVLTDADGVQILQGDGVELPTLVVTDPRGLAGEVSVWFYDNPGADLVTVGITGTNGKTTTSYFVDTALRAVHGLTAVLGTVELRIGDRAIESPRTTVEAPVLQGIMALAKEQGAGSLVTEVSSHAIALERIAGAHFDVVAFTNLQRDHLDFHGTMEGYFADKSRLFTSERAGVGVVVVDDEWGRRLAAQSPIPVQTIATRSTDGAQTPADWNVVSADIGLDGVGSKFILRAPDGTEHEAFSPLPGLVNVSNAATAVVVAHLAGVPLAVAIAAIAQAAAIPGRMERVIERGLGLPLGLVDYAHTPDALVLALEAVRPITKGRLVVVLGSDGDRDQGKRPLMGQIAAQLADEVFVTDENPRSEDPATIRQAILVGARAVPQTIVHEVTTSRTEAIRAAVASCQEGDTVIVTGKGHEPTQEIAGVFHRYNDRDVFEEILATHQMTAPGTAGTTISTEVIA